MSQFDAWKLLAGLGIFLFGIYLMEDSIKGLAGRSFKKLVRRYTHTRITAMLTGVSTTAILQSSSAITLMVLAFVGAGIMSLENAVGVILGSNLGTTFTAWIVAFFGFKISIESFALPLIGIGGLGMIFFSSKSRLLNLSKLLIGFGFLFHGLDYMKVSVEQLTSFFEVDAVAGLGLWVFTVAGILMTALMHSSSATIAIVLTGINAGAIGLTAGAAMVIGANIGTTATVMLGAAGKVPIKKRVAWSHFIFNLVAALAAFVLLPLLVWTIETGLGWQDQAVMGIALFHTLFNLIGVLIFLPFVPLLTATVSRLFPEPERMFTHYIQNTSPEIPDAAIAAFNKEVLHQYKESRNYLVMLYSLKGLKQLKHTSPSPADQTFTGSVTEFYLRLKELHGEIFEYYAKINATELENEEAKELDRYLRSSRSIMNAVKNLKGIGSDIEGFELSDTPFLNEGYSSFTSRLEEFLGDLDSVIDLGGEDQDRIAEILEETFKKVEANDADFIRGSSNAIRRGELEDIEATTLLMVNRLFTQSCRMIVFSLRGLLVPDELNREGESESESESEEIFTSPMQGVQDEGPL